MPAIQAYARYQSIRHRLPQVRRAAPALTVSGLEEIAEQFDVFLFDAYGVLNVGSSAIAGTAEVVAALQAQGKECFVVSNAAGFEKNFYLGKYSGLGYDFALENIVTSRDALLEALAEYSRQLTWGRIGAAEHQTDLADYQIIDQDAPQFLQADGFLFFSHTAGIPNAKPHWKPRLSIIRAPSCSAIPISSRPLAKHRLSKQVHTPYSSLMPCMRKPASSANLSPPFTTSW